jgi:hypothetical protein
LGNDVLAGEARLIQTAPLSRTEPASSETASRRPRAEVGTHVIAHLRV